jgi:transcriptional regulator with XRE-family HTH domain
VAVVSVVSAEPWGARLRRLREARGMSRAELASACVGVGRRAIERNDIIRYEAGAYWPRLPTFAALAEALGVSMDVLWYGEAEAARIAGERESNRLLVPGEGPPEA